MDYWHPFINLIKPLFYTITFKYIQIELTTFIFSLSHRCDFSFFFNFKSDLFFPKQLKVFIYLFFWNWRKKWGKEYETFGKRRNKIHTLCARCNHMSCKKEEFGCSLYWVLLIISQVLNIGELLFLTEFTLIWYFIIKKKSILFRFLIHIDYLYFEKQVFLSYL